MLGAHADDRRLGFEAVVEAHFDALGAGDHVQVGEDDAGVDDHDAAADAFDDVAVLLLLVPDAAHAHHGFANGLVGLGRARRERDGLERVQHRGVDVLLRDRARRRRETDVQQTPLRRRRACTP